jgi:hypothetical protein
MARRKARLIEEMRLVSPAASVRPGKTRPTLSLAGSAAPRPAAVTGANSATKSVLGTERLAQTLVAVGSSRDGSRRRRSRPSLVNKSNYAPTAIERSARRPPGPAAPSTRPPVTCAQPARLDSHHVAMRILAARSTSHSDSPEVTRREGPGGGRTEIVTQAEVSRFAKLLSGSVGLPPSFNEFMLPVQDRPSICFERLGARVLLV